MGRVSVDATSDTQAPERGVPLDSVLAQALVCYDPLRPSSHAIMCSMIARRWVSMRSS